LDGGRATDEPVTSLAVDEHEVIERQPLVAQRFDAAGAVHVEKELLEAGRRGGGRVVGDQADGQRRPSLVDDMRWPCFVVPRRVQHRE
jgi:hypothetical protein